MEKLVLDGKVFVKAARAADTLGYTSDYIGQLCRSGKIDAHLVGRSWYVNQEQLREHKTNKQRSSKVKAREQIKRSIKEAQAAKTTHLRVRGTGMKAFESRITYEEDEKELMPEVKKLTVLEKTPEGVSKKAHSVKQNLHEELGPNYTIENEGEKIVMSGTVDVTDATEEEILDDNVVLMKAKIVKSQPKKQSKQKKRSIKETKAISVKETEGSKDAEVPIDRSQIKKTDFESKLATMGVDEADVLPVEVGEPTVSTPHLPKQQEQSISSLPVVLTAGVCFVALVIMLLVEVSWSYQSSEDDTGFRELITDWIVDTPDLLGLRSR